MKAKWLRIGVCCAIVIAMGCSDGDLQQTIDNKTAGLPAELAGLEGCLFDNLAQALNVQQVIGDLIAGLESGNLPPGVERQFDVAGVATNIYLIDMLIDLDGDGAGDIPVEGSLVFDEDPEDANGFAPGEGATLSFAFDGSFGGSALAGSLWARFNRTAPDSYRITGVAGSISGGQGCSFLWGTSDVGPIDITDTDLPRLSTNIPGTGVTIVGTMDIELLLDGASIPGLPNTIKLRLHFPVGSNTVEFNDIRDISDNPLADDFSMDLELIFGGA